MSEGKQRQGNDESRALALWATWAPGPVAWALHQNISYASLEWVCAYGGYTLLHVVSLLTLAMAGAGGMAAWRGLRAAASASSERGRGYRRFLATIGLALCVLSLTGIALESLPNFVLDACTGAA